MDPQTVQGIGLLSATAASIGFVHTLLGPDHYLPFLAMSRARQWSLNKTVLITLACGIGHVLSSVVLGLLGIAFGVAVFKLETIEAFRGSIAGWMLLAFGVIYLAWGIRQAIRNRPHTHVHHHPDGIVHAHEHSHHADHLHVHNAVEAPVDPVIAAPPPTEAEDAAASITPWVLFTIFLFGPCEPLIPLVMYPAAEGSLLGIGVVTAVFGGVTLATMTALVVIAHKGMEAMPLARFHRFGHALAGLALVACGAAVKLGL